MDKGNIFKQVSIYIDEKNGQVYFLPNGWHEILGIVVIDHVEQLTLPLEEFELFDKVRLCLNLCYSKSPPQFPAKESPLAIKLGKKSYGIASKNKKFVVLEWRKEQGYTIFPSKKDRSGGYDHLSELAESIGNELHSKALLDAMNNAISNSSI